MYLILKKSLFDSLLRMKACLLTNELVSIYRPFTCLSFDTDAVSVPLLVFKWQSFFTIPCIGSKGLGAVSVGINETKKHVSFSDLFNIYTHSYSSHTAYIHTYIHTPHIHLTTLYTLYIQHSMHSIYNTLYTLYTTLYTLYIQHSIYKYTHYTALHFFMILWRPVASALQPRPFCRWRRPGVPSRSAARRSLSAPPRTPPSSRRLPAAR